MSVMIQIRNVPEDLHRKMKSRAALAGMSLSDYLLSEIRTISEKPTLDEWIARVNQLSRVELSLSPTDMLREERDRR